jgi:hypothetical protein
VLSLHVRVEVVQLVWHTGLNHETTEKLCHSSHQVDGELCTCHGLPCQAQLRTRSVHLLMYMCITSLPCLV